MPRISLSRWVLLAGILTTIWISWVTSGSSRSVVRVLNVSLFALAWAALVAWALRRFVGLHDPAETPAPRLDASASAVWFAPATILLLLQPTLIGLLAGLGMTVFAARLLSAPSWMPDSAEPPLAVLMPRSSLDIGAGELPYDLLCRHFLPALTVAAGYHAATVAFSMHHALFAVGVLALSTALLSTVAVGLGVGAIDQPRDLHRSFLALGLCAILALIAGRAIGGGGGDSDDPAVAQRTAAGSGAPVTGEINPNAPPEIGVPGGYPGVILWPEIKPVVALVAPPARGAGISPLPARPLTIPFGGVYWMFRWPHQRPPRTSLLQRGTPSGLAFATTDKTRLEMEARQSLAAPLSIRCCSRIRVSILNADPYPATVFLDVALVDSQSPNAVQRLGARPVQSVPDREGDATIPVSETLDFPFPAAPRISQFDEIKVTFPRAISRYHRSARISIERFILVPR